MRRRIPKRNISKSPAGQEFRGRLLFFRLVALAGAPLVFFGALELSLRLVGFGYPTAFLLKSSNHGEKTLVQNNQFGWRFFGPTRARSPGAISIPRQKRADTIRIFVFGESAAYGDPQPRFGLPRMIEALLSLRHVDKKFEVVNAAMTAINSHVILPLARDCEQAHADAWVIYMGNNEVVGPFGAGTVFGNQALPLPLIRLSLTLKATQIGQLIERSRIAAGSKSGGGGEWEGMRMFVKYKIRASDPRLETVYANFERNLRDIIAAGQSCGAKIVLSTVGVNLKDCGPFASLHRPDLSDSQSNAWQGLFDSGRTAQQGGDFQQAAADYDQAEHIDESFAELRFRRGQCDLASNDYREAKKEFAAALDLDALRFRCDDRLNDLIRRQAHDDVTLADGERTLAELSRDGMPGGDFFYEHVHLTFDGNYVLARAIAEKIEKVLTLPGGAAWPEPKDCARRLGYTQRDTQLALSDVLGRLSDVPFTFQVDHDEQVRRLTEAALALPQVNSAASLAEAQSAAEAALAQWPKDAVLWEQLSEIKQTLGDYPGATAAARHSLDETPSNAECWLQFGALLAQQENYHDAEPAFRRVIGLDPQAVWARNDLAMCLDKLGHRDQAIAELKHALALRPKYGTGWLTLGQLYEELGHTNDAERCYSIAVTNRINQVDDLVELARFCFNRRRFDLALTNFVAAIALSPSDARLRLEAGRTLVALGRHAKAAQAYQAAVKMDPNQAQAHLQLGVELGRLRRPAQAEDEFREVLRLKPDLTQARVNLGIALYEEEKLADALEQFDAVLQSNANDATALRYVQLLRNRTAVNK